MTKETNIVLFLLTLLGALSGLFIFVPELDLHIAALFFDPTQGGFWLKDEPFAKGLRFFFMNLPKALMAVVVFIFLLRFVLKKAPPKPRLRMVVFLALTFALGPGLLVNVFLKEYSARPRPVHIKEFGGAHIYKPAYDFSGACQKNCSFVSGEAASSTWVWGFTLFAPSPIKVATQVASATYIASASGLRVAFGGHFFSDVTLSILLNLLVLYGASLLLKLPITSAQSDSWEKYVKQARARILGLKNPPKP